MGLADESQRTVRLRAWFILTPMQPSFGFQWDLQEVFQFDIPEVQADCRNFKSAREAVEFVTFTLDESGRLIY